MIGLLPYALAAIAALGIWAWDATTIRNQRERIAQLTAEVDDPMVGWRRQLAVCAAGRGDAIKAIEDNNTKIVELGRATKAQADASARAAGRAAADAAATMAAVEAALTSPRPIPGGTACENALAIQREPLP